VAYFFGQPVYSSLFTKIGSVAGKQSKTLNQLN